MSEVVLVLEDGSRIPWASCVVRLNHFIRSHYQSIRRIEDKQIGWWFIPSQDGEIQLQQVKDKLMFYLWDSVFAKDRRPLKQVIDQYLGQSIELITFADFLKHTEAFLQSFDTF